MIKLTFPDYNFKTKKTANKELIFDPFRKKWVTLTPEEWVRQNFVQYLVREKKYPAALIAMEKMIKLGELRKRFDILVFDRNHRPWMMIECKSPAIKMDEAVLHQLLRYHISVQTGYLIITNGEYSYGWEKKENSLFMLRELPLSNDKI